MAIFIKILNSQNFDMAKEKECCSSCNIKVSSSTGSVRFKCPNCGTEEIVRCRACRIRCIPYVCKSCGFEGPNWKWQK